MARQALPPEVGRRLRSAQLHVGIMTSDAAQAAIALDRAPAHLHLFWVTKRFDDIRVQGYGSSKDGNDVSERRTGPEVQVCLAGPQDTRISAKMALDAHVIAKVLRKAGGIDD